MINLHSGPDLIGSGVRNVGGSPKLAQRVAGALQGLLAATLCGGS
jgi:hypothetical protein